MTAITNSVAHNIYETTRQAVLACISNPVQFPDSSPHIDVPRVRNRAICIARLDPVKGHTHLLRAWKLLCDRGERYELDLVGEGTLFSELSAQVERDGIGDLVRFLGFTSDVSSAIESALFAILVSEVEGQGIVTLEAASKGRASLLTAVPGSVDLLPPDATLANGLEFGNAVQLADALEQWFAHPEQVVEEGARFFRFLRATSDPARIATEYRRLYQRIAARVV
jgi:glycosyltransferase involved in cell wall biosynthesis